MLCCCIAELLLFAGYYFLSYILDGGYCFFMAEASIHRRLLKMICHIQIYAKRI